MKRCFDCRKEISDKLLRCESCAQESVASFEKARRPLTDYERLKLSWYRSEKKWIDHIQNRQVITDKQGKKHAVTVDPRGNIRPMPQPK